MKYCILIFLSTIGTAISDDQRSVFSKRLISTERIMVITFEGVTDQLIQSFQIDTTVQLFFVSLTNGEHRQIGLKDNTPGNIAFLNRSMVEDISIRLNAESRFMNLSLDQIQNDSVVVHNDILRLIVQILPSQIMVILPKGLRSNISSVSLTSILHHSVSLKAIYTIPNLNKNIKVSPSIDTIGYSSFIVPMRYKKTSIDLLRKYQRYIIPRINEWSNNEISTEEKIAIVFKTTVWLGRLLQNDRTNVAAKIVESKKIMLDEYHNALIGFSVNCEIEDSILVGRQLTYLKVNDIINGTTDSVTAIFQDQKDGWIVNELYSREHILTIGSHIPLVSPEQWPVTIPTGEKYSTSYFRSKFTIIFIRYDKRAAYRTHFRKTFYFHHSPRFTVSFEPTTLLRGRDRLIRFSFVNYTHDRVEDTIKISDSILQSTAKYFSISKKNQMWTDTSHLTWHMTSKDSQDTYHQMLINKIPIGDIGSYGINSFNLDTTRFYVRSSLSESALLQSINRLGLPYEYYNARQKQLAPSRILIDRNTILSSDEQQALIHHVREGAHVIILLEQNMWVQKVLKMVGIQLSIHENFITEISSNISSTFSQKTQESLFKNWLFLYSQYHLTTETGSIETSISDENMKNPLVFSVNSGKGNILIINLALSTQLAVSNINAIRFLNEVIHQKP